MLLTSALLLGSLSLAEAASYNLFRYMAGNNFFNHFQFNGGWNFTLNTPIPDVTTSGDVFFPNRTYATATDLVSVLPNGHVILKVDNTTGIPYPDKRYAISVNTTEQFGVGSVFVHDVVHLPFGCSVWPSLWTASVNWPSGGEIDILEAVNLQTTNQMALHTSAGCTLQASASQMTGTVGFTNCGDSATTNFGCTVHDPNADSFGAGFNSAGGGMWVTELATTGISIWFFTRANIPATLTTAQNISSIDTSTLGTPVAFFSPAGCPINTFFAPQSLVIDITLCGDFARGVFNQTCSGPGANPCYTTYVIGPPSYYDNAYFEIASIRVFTNGQAQIAGTELAPDAGSSGLGGGGGTSGSSGTGSGGSAGHSAAGSLRLSSVLPTILAGLGLLALACLM